MDKPDALSSGTWGWIIVCIILIVLFMVAAVPFILFPDPVRFP